MVTKFARDIFGDNRILDTSENNADFAPVRSQNISTTWAKTDAADPPESPSTISDAPHPEADEVQTRLGT